MWLLAQASFGHLVSNRLPAKTRTLSRCLAFVILIIIPILVAVWILALPQVGAKPAHVLAHLHVTAVCLLLCSLFAVGCRCIDDVAQDCSRRLKLMVRPIYIRKDFYTWKCALWRISESFWDSVKIHWISVNRTPLKKIQWVSESFWDSVKIPWVSVNIAPLKKISESVRVSEIQWKFTEFQTPLKKIPRTAPLKKIQWCYIDWDSVNFHWNQRHSLVLF